MSKKSENNSNFLVEKLSITNYISIYYVNINFKKRLVMKEKQEIATGVGNPLLLAPTDTKMAKVLEEALNLLKRYPEITERIRQDQEKDGKESKLPRVLDKRWKEEQTLPLPLKELLAIEGEDLIAEKLELKVGRPRLKPEVVYLFMTLRGCYGSVCSQESWDRFSDSLTLRYYLDPYIKRLPGRTTVLENLNGVSEETRSFIVDCQLSTILDTGLDDFLKQTIDSTSVKANSAWPTELHLIKSLLTNAYHLGQRLDRFGLENFRQWHVLTWLQQLANLEFEVNLSSRRKRREFMRAYRKFVTKAVKIVDYLAGEYERLEDRVSGVNLMPSLQSCLTQLWERLESNLCESYILLEYTAERVLGSGDTSREAHEEIYSVSDRSARFIKKGGRQTVFGYKIQLGRSANGFITSVLVPEGNAADSELLLLMVLDHLQRTGVIPNLVSTDDGYASAKGRNDVINLGVNYVSISGSKGKKLIPEEDWTSEIYSQARSDRSAVESLMFTTKHGFEFGQFHRRGIDSVRCEMLEKVMAYNFWRISYERNRQTEKLKLGRRQAA